MAIGNAESSLNHVRSKAVILVGGGSKGTRFRPLSLDLPKPLFPIAGLPMIQHHVEALCKVDGLMEIILMGFFDETLFNGFIESVSAETAVPVRYLREDQGNGTAGGLYCFRDVVMQGNPHAVFVLHCDIGCSFPLKDMLAFHMTSPRHCTVLGKELSESESHKYGAMVVDGSTHELQHYAEKPSTDISSIVNCGVYIFSPACFDHLAKVGDVISHGASTYQSYYGRQAKKMFIENDVLMALAGKGCIYVFETSDFWCQIKDPSAALQCSRLYLEHFMSSRPGLLASSAPKLSTHIGRVPSSGQFSGSVGVASKRLTIVDPVYIHPTAKVDPAAKIGPNVSIGAGVVIGPGARLKDCIVLEDVRVADHAVIRESIVGWGSSIGYWARVQGSEEKPCIFGAGVTASPEIIVSGSTVLPHKTLSHSCHDQIIL
jgi:mannose-1-phosphate guanylyltransferase